jgi:long-chain fatty acid transport protein
MTRPLALAIAAALLGASSTASAITDLDSNASLSFNLSNPGARSLGLGGAFLGLADDATAAYSNPAGLTQLVQPEISLEGRHTTTTVPFIDGGSASINPFNGSGLQTSETSSSKNNPSYFSFVYPRENWAFAFYRQELARFHSDFFSTGVDLGNIGVLLPYASVADLKIVNYGFSAAWKANDMMSLGIGVSYYDFKFNSVSTRVDDLGPGDPTIASQQVQDGSDKAWGVTLGARFRLSDTWSAGLVYRHVPKFRYSASNIVLEDFDGLPLDPPTVIGSNKVSFDVPDLYGAGLSWHPTEQLLVNFDADYVVYSQLSDGIESLFGAAAADAAHLKVPDGTQLHLGAEYTFAQMQHPFSLRAGVWHDPQHSIRFKGDPTNNEVQAILFSAGRGGVYHYAFGGGFAFKKFQIDIGADLSDEVDTYSVSGVYRF